MEAGLPGHVVHMYREQSTERLTQRMKNIMKNALRSPEPATPSTSTAIDAASNLIVNKTRRAIEANFAKWTRNGSRQERKMECEYLASSSEREEGGGTKKKKRKIDIAKEAQENHKNKCARVKKP